MADRPILFSGPMIRALLDGRKTMTRRVLKGIEPLPNETWHIYGNGGGVVGVETGRVPQVALDYVPFDVGDRLWVRETWNVADAYLAPERRQTALAIMNYAATPWGVPGKWRSPIFMPRWASRLTLIVTDVRVQRLQEISEADARAEGVENCGEPDGGRSIPGEGIVLYRSLWDSLNADRGYGWDTNPWVAALSFSVVKENIDSLSREAA